MASDSPSILIVDDEEEICDLVCEQLTVEGYACDVASNANDALAKLKMGSYDVALLDIKLPGMSGIDLLKIVEKSCKMTAIVMMTAVKDLGTAVEVMKLGAVDYVVKPFTLDKLNNSVSAALKSKKAPCAISDTLQPIRDEGNSNSAKYRSFSEIDAIAYGVEAQVDYFDFHSKIVTNKTIEVARWLGLPEKNIEKWAIARNELYSERDRRIKSALSKLERNPMAQVLLGLTYPMYQFPQSSEDQH